MVSIPKVEEVAIEKLSVDGKNPNKMSNEQLRALEASIEEFGFSIPIVTNEEYVVADGEHRLKAAQNLGMKFVPVVRLPLREVDRRILRQVLNKLRGTQDSEKDIFEYLAVQEENELAHLERLLALKENDLRAVIEESQSLPNVIDQKEPELVSEIIVTLYMDRAKFEKYRKDLDEMGKDGVTVNIS